MCSYCHNPGHTKEICRRFLRLCMRCGQARHMAKECAQPDTHSGSSRSSSTDYPSCSASSSDSVREVRPLHSRLRRLRLLIGLLQVCRFCLQYYFTTCFFPALAIFHCSLYLSTFSSYLAYKIRLVYYD